MRILEEKISEEKISYCRNPGCGCKFAYSPKDDTYSGLEGIYVCCPKCRRDTLVEKFERPAQFPESYYYFGDGVHIQPEKIEEWVKTGIKHCLTRNEDNFYCGTGDSWVEIQRFEDDDMFNIIVAQGYYNKDLSIEDAKKLVDY